MRSISVIRPARLVWRSAAISLTWRRRVQVVARPLGRRDHAARAADAHHPGRPRRVRAQLDQSAHRRGHQAGIRFGRPPKLTRHQQEQALKLLDQGEPHAVGQNVGDA
jgi:hypothetical protein